MTSRVFVSPAQSRDTVFFLGAGASVAANAPLQNELLPRILAAPSLPTALHQDRHHLSKFLARFFRGSPDLEEVFGFVDFLLAEQQSLGPDYPVPAVREIRERLVRLIHHCVAVSQATRSLTYRRFWEVAKSTSLNISIVTTNYDTLLDEAFDPLYPNDALIDYGIHFMNYEWYGSDVVDIRAFDWWINPREPVVVWTDGRVPVPIKLLKIHGSLSWHYCSTCGQVLLTPWSTAVPGVRPDATPEIADPLVPAQECPWDGGVFRPLIVPPSHFKSLNNLALARLRAEVAQELRSTDRLVFVGYSFPPADVHLKALITMNLRKSCEIVVVDPAVGGRTRAAYDSLDRPTTYLNCRFEDALEDPVLQVAMFGAAQQSVAAAGDSPRR